MPSRRPKPSQNPLFEPLLALAAIEAKRREVITEYLLLWLVLESHENSKKPAEENGLSDGLFELRERPLKFTDPSGLYH